VADSLAQTGYDFNKKGVKMKKIILSTVAISVLLTGVLYSDTQVSKEVSVMN